MQKLVEREPARIGLLAATPALAVQFFLIPLAVTPAYVLLKKLRASARPFFAVVTVCALAGGLTASLYLSYPRNDAYVPSHSYTLADTDIAVARFIEEDARGMPHVVLANQVTASAAIAEFGFKTYYTVPDVGAVFYYPLPSGSPLVKEYTAMMRAPSLVNRMFSGLISRCNTPA